MAMLNREHIIPVRRVWPPDGDMRETNFDVVFFHGIQFRDATIPAWEGTWLTRISNECEAEECWPRTWLPHDLGGNVRVLLLEYDCNATKEHGRGNAESVRAIAHNLFQSLVIGEKLGQKGSFVLIGHSYGGLVLKSLVVEAKSALTWNSTSNLDKKCVQSAKAFLKNMSGIVFYAVPHAGLQSLNKYVTECKKIYIRRQAPISDILKESEVFYRGMEDLSTSFENITKVDSTNIYAFVEGRPSTPDGELVVQYASAIRLSTRNHYTLEDCSHLDVCRPPSKGHPSYKILLEYILANCRNEDLAENVADLCGGLPLSLEVMGSHFKAKRDPRLWKEGGDVLRTKKEVVGVLGISYEGLAAEEQQMFLDISCLFLDLNRRYCENMVEKATYFWEGCGIRAPFNKLRNLIDKSLVVCNGFFFEMHDQLRDLGRCIVAGESCRLGERSRLWDGEKIFKEGLESRQVPLQLRYLDIRNCKSMTKFPNSLCNLMMLQWMVLDGCKRLESLPDSFGNLVELKHLEVSNCPQLKELPYSFCHLKELQKLIIKDCGRWKKLPDLFGNLTSLMSLVFHSLEALEDLPESFGNLQALQIVDMGGCENLKKLPQSMGQLHALQKLTLLGSKRLEALPRGFTRLNALEVLDLKYCGKLGTLPNSIGLMTSLQRLSLANCGLLEELPTSLCKLAGLQKLDLYGCRSLSTLPDDFGRLKCLETLVLSGCTTLTHLPASFGELLKLYFLSMWGCQHFCGVQSLPHTVCAVNMGGCYQLAKLPNLGHCGVLEHLDLNGCKELTQLLGLEFLTALTHLNVRGCTNLDNATRLRVQEMKERIPIMDVYKGDSEDETTELFAKAWKNRHRRGWPELFVRPDARVDANL